MGVSGSSLTATQKRHLVAQKHVIWRIQRRRQPICHPGPGMGFIFAASRGKVSGGSRGLVWGGDMASAGARAYNGGLGAEPQQEEPLVRESGGPPEAEKLFSLERPKEGQICPILGTFSAQCARGTIDYTV